MGDTLDGVRVCLRSHLQRPGDRDNHAFASLEGGKGRWEVLGKGPGPYVSA